MDKIEQRVLTYSLLAYIRSKGNLTESPIHIYVPLVKRALAKLNNANIYKGRSIMEIQTVCTELYHIDFPIPVLRKILIIISKEVNTEVDTQFILNQDDSFQIRHYTFTEFEEVVENHKLEIEKLEKLFEIFCSTCVHEKPKSKSLLEFIEKNKYSLTKYLGKIKISNKANYGIEAQFVEFFKKTPQVYDVIKRIYLGSILSCYIEYKTEDVKTGVELIFDTNFLLGLLDLNTAESAHTCKKIVEITKSQGYKLYVLRDTLTETSSLLKAKIEGYEVTFLQRLIYPEDIYNACERRNLNVADLERIASQLEDRIVAHGIKVIHDTTKYQNLAKFSKEYEFLKKIRHTDQSALHDATAIMYVREKRKKKVVEFEGVNCWFVNNARNRDKYAINELEKEQSTLDFQPETIRADDFLNIIWLSNPGIARYDELADIGLTSLITLGLHNSLPKQSIINELEDNIHKYAQSEDLSDSDIVRIATRITTKQLTEIDALNKLAKKDKTKFVERLVFEANKQKEVEQRRESTIEKILVEYEEREHKLNQLELQYEEKIKSLTDTTTSIAEKSSLKDNEIQTLKHENETLKKEAAEKKAKDIELKREEYINSQLKIWRKKSDRAIIIWGFILVGAMALLFNTCNWNISNVFSNSKLSNMVIIAISLLSIIFTPITLKHWYDKRYNYSNVESYKKTIKLPNELA